MGRAYVKDYYNLLGVPIENIETANYNVTGIPAVVSAGELETILTKRFPKARVTYNPAPSLQAVCRRVGVMKVFDDSYA